MLSDSEISKFVNMMNSSRWYDCVRVPYNPGMAISSFVGQLHAQLRASEVDLYTKFY